MENKQRRGLSLEPEHIIDEQVTIKDADIARTSYLD